jgi:phenylacetate-coenzyme A ligase PaaK-like adenylate-forming protein
MAIEQLYDQIFRIKTREEFNALSLEIFYFQYANNQVYHEFCNLLHKDPSVVKTQEAIPFLPVEFFRTQKIICNNNPVDVVFKSSGTTTDNASSHYISDVSLYEKSFQKCFSYFFGDPTEYTFLALLPGYLERQNSSLVYMMRKLINLSGFPEDSGFFLYDHEKLFEKLTFLSKQKNRKVLLIGVSYAMLDFYEKYKLDFPGLIVVETGGMKGIRKEMIREELHVLLKKAFNVDRIYSEYGMTELLSQAYSKGSGTYCCPPWMRVSLRDPEDPLRCYESGSGVINITDLANMHSCSFIATSDLGKVHADNEFEILGRLDYSDIRGCNLLVT